MVQYSDITEDGTYMVDAHGDLHRMEYSTGYMVGVKPINVIPTTEKDDTNIPKLTLVGRWTNESEDVQYGPGEYDYDTVDVVYWDEVELIDNLLDAGNIARERGELAIWDNLNGCEIRV